MATNTAFGTDAGPRAKLEDTARSLRICIDAPVSRTAVFLVVCDGLRRNVHGKMAPALARIFRGNNEKE